VSAVAGLKERAYRAARERAVRTGRLPREAYAHYFIEDRGLHSRVHLQNFWSALWPDVDAPAVAHIELRDAAGQRLGAVDRHVPRFGQLFLEVSGLLEEVGSTAGEGTVAIDLEPPDQVRERFDVIPKVADAELNTPFWMSYYDATENYMYVHSIEKVRGPVYGAPAALRVMRGRQQHDGGRWRSWRLLDAEDLAEVHVVTINHADAPGHTTVGLYTPQDRPIVERRLEFGPRQLHRVEFTADDIAPGLGDAEHVRIGLNPMLTTNGKPYVIMRYGDGPLSLHHG
jgi:hypothetical protein